MQHAEDDHFFLGSFLRLCYGLIPKTHKTKGEIVNEILICGGILLIMLLRRLDQHEEVGTHATVRHDVDDSSISIGYTPGIGTDTNRWTNPMYAYELDNMYHNTPVDPTYHGDSLSCSSSADSFSSCSSFDD